MKQVVLIVLVALATMGLMPGVVLAAGSATSEETQNVNEVDQQVVIQDVEGLRLNLVQNVQDPGTKKIKFDVVIDSSIDSDRVEVTWTVSGQSVIAEGMPKEVLKVKSGAQVSHSIVVSPAGFGVTRVKVIVQAYEIDGTRVATGAKAFVTDNQKSLLIPDQQQQLANTLYTVRNVAGVILAIVMVLTIGYLGYIYFKSWLDSDKT